MSNTSSRISWSVPSSYKGFGVRRNGRNSDLAISKATIPASMWDPSLHGKGTLFYKIGQHRNHFEFSAPFELDNLESQVRSSGFNRMEYRSDTIAVEKLRHYWFIAQLGENKIHVLIPEDYVNERPEAARAFLEALDTGFAALPEEHHFGVIKRVKLNLGRHPFAVKEDDYYLIVTGKSVEFYHGHFLPSIEPSQAARDKEEHFARMILPDKKGFNSRGDTVTDNGLYHEIGHLLIDEIRDKHKGLEIPHDIFPKGSELRRRKLKINKHFTGNSWDNKRDYWISIAGADKKKPGRYSKESPSDDHAETAAAGINSLILANSRIKPDELERFKKAFPHRSAAFFFLEELAKK